MMNSQASPQKSSKKSLDRLLKSILEGYSPTAAEAVQLWQLTQKSEVQALGQAADQWRQLLVGDTVGWRSQVSLFFTNVCELKPCLYDYPREPGEKGAYVYSIDDMDARLEAAQHRQVTHVFLAGGLWSSLCIPGLEAANILQTYGRLVGYVRERYPALQIHGFSADTIDFLRILSGRSVQYVLAFLKDAGLGGLSGVGAEILVDRVRANISPKLMTVKEWVGVMAAAHRVGLELTASMAFGHVETVAERAEHLAVLRKFQEQHEGAFQAFMPYAVSSSAGLKAVGLTPLSREERLQGLAVARLFWGERLPVLESPWYGHSSIEQSMEEVQEALQWGANDMGATDSLAYEHFLAGSREEPTLTPEAARRLIEEAHRSPTP